MRRAFVFMFGLAALAVFALVLGSWGEGGEAQANCRAGDVLEGVHHPARIKVIDRCVTVRGTVAIVRDHEDGDWDIGLVPDPPDLDLLGRGNLTKLGGLLVVEVIPMDQPTVKRPRAGSRIAVTGAYVVDTPNGWREIHPAWQIEELTPSPIPEGAGAQVRSVARLAKRALLRLRAEIRELSD
ncbi:MAG: hypothetical protein HY675_04695 [Chloroflexi bacterium]|nr:hypothetical protein [Chloroflexota bacterium]